MVKRWISLSVFIGQMDPAQCERNLVLLVLVGMSHLCMQLDQALAHPRLTDPPFLVHRTDVSSTSKICLASGAPGVVGMGSVVTQLDQGVKAMLNEQAAFCQSLQGRQNPALHM